MALTGLGRMLAIGLILMSPLLFAGEPGTVSFTRSGADQLAAASVSSGENLTFTYDAGYGQMTRIQGSPYSLSLTSDPLLHLPIAQTISDTSGTILLEAVMTYGADGLRASRTPSAGSASSATNYWYGGNLHPLVVTREGVTYRLIGKGIVEEVTAAPTRTYAHSDHLGSVRLVTDDQGAVTKSLSYDGDYGLTRIAGQSTASTDASVASFYRFQGQEQEVFPLAELGIENDALAQWLDQIQFYHFPWRDYAAGLAAFTQTDPIPAQDSLYTALGANPVNITDETGGMLNNEALPFTPAHLNISPPLQVLLDRLLENPSANFSFDDIIDMQELRLAVIRQRFLMNDNPFPPRGILGKRSTETFLGQMNVTEQRRRDALRALMNLHREQDRWLATYMRPISALWDRVNNTVDPWDNLRNPLDALDVDEDHNGQDHSIRQIEQDIRPRDADPNNAPDEEDDSKMPELMTDVGSGDAQLLSNDAEVQIPNPPVHSVEENGDDDRKQQDREGQHGDEEHGHQDKSCCNIL